MGDRETRRPARSTVGPRIDGGAMPEAGGYDQGGTGSQGAPAGGYAPPPPQGGQPGPAGWQAYQSPPPYQGQAPYPPYYARPTNNMAIAAIIVAFVFPPAGIVLGVIAKNQIAQSGEQGEGLATAAIVIGSIYVALAVIAVIAFFAIFGVVASNVGGNSTGNSVRLLVGG